MPGDNSGTPELHSIKQNLASTNVLCPYCSYGCSGFRRAEIETGGDLTGVVLVDIQAKTTTEYSQGYIVQRSIGLVMKWRK